MNKFWNWVRNEDTGASELIFNGPISEDTWFGDEITPAMFRNELSKVSGDLTVWLNSPGGDVFAASQIYTMLRNHKGKVTVKIDGIAASAASVIAMAGTKVLMAPTALMMIHNPATIAMGDHEDMQKAIEMLDEVKESIINAYELRTNLTRAKISHMMDATTWMNAKKAIELGFADATLVDEKRADDEMPAYAFSDSAVERTLINKLTAKAALTKPQPDFEIKETPAPETPAEPTGRSVDDLKSRLMTIKQFM